MNNREIVDMPLLFELRDKGYRNETIALILGVKDETVRTILGGFDTQGLDRAQMELKEMRRCA